MASAADREAVDPRPRGTGFARRILKDPLVLGGLIVVAAVVSFALFAELIAPFSPDAQDLSNRLAEPFSPRDGVAVLGADPLGRDMLSRIIHGARVSLAVAGAAVFIAGLVGTFLGLVAGLSRRWAGDVIMRIADVQFSIPTLVLALALVAVLGASVSNIIIVLAVSGWVPYARVVRAQVLTIREMDFIEAVRGLGASTPRIVIRHVLPHTFGTVAVIATIEMAHMIITEASLSFLGLGVPTGTATWGAMIADGRNYLSSAWWVSTFPGLAILVTVLALNIVGDALSDAANPVLRDW